MVNENVLKNYSDSIRRLKKQCMDAGMSEEEFRALYFESLQPTLRAENTWQHGYRRTYKYANKALIVFVLITTVTVLKYNTIYSFAACNLQEYIYPGLKMLRKLSIPLISLFPSLTALYHETCLIQNPFFTVVDMDCWPCSTVNDIREIYEPKPVSEHQTPPFFYETEQNVISMESLKKMYMNNKELFHNEAPKVSSESKHFIHPSQMFLQNQSGEKKFYVWKFNTMNIAKILRQIIQRPKVVPKFGQSTERFIIVDTSQESFKLPDTECSFSFLLSLSGTRTIQLVPAEECRHQCKTLKMELQESYLLWYNWWYWRPVVQQSNGNSTFIAHVGSYC